jgi:hypothetical protein
MIQHRVDGVAGVSVKKISGTYLLEVESNHASLGFAPHR